MVHAYFQDHLTTCYEDLKVLVVSGHGGPLGHDTIFINSCPSFPRRLHIKFDFDMQSRFREQYVCK